MTQAEKERLDYLMNKPTITVDEANEIQTLKWGGPVGHLSLHEAVMKSSRARLTEPSEGSVERTQD